MSYSTDPGIILHAATELATQLTPFQSKLIVEAVGIDDLAHLADFQILLIVNGVAKLRFKKESGGGWEQWQAEEGSNQAECHITFEHTDEWRGLVSMQSMQIDNEGNTTTQPEKILYLCIKSGFTEQGQQPDEPTITFSTSFSCNDMKQLLFSCAIHGIPANYIIQIKLNNEWQRLYNGLINRQTVDAPHELHTVHYTALIPINRQLPAREYLVRVIDQLTGAGSIEQSIYIPNCNEGKEACSWPG